MKNKLLLSLIVSLFAVSAWAADVTVKEAYVLTPTSGAKTTRSPFDGRYSKWYYNFARSKTTDKIGSDRAFWTDHKTNDVNNKDCYLETTLEGGLKAVSFKWQQGNAADYPDNLYLGVEINDMQVDFREAASVNTGIAVKNYNQTFAVKENNVKFALFNRSSTDRANPTDIGRILIGPITFTPYLLYTQKDITIGLKQKGYYNNELINNTGSEGSISYSSSNEGVVKIDANGVVTPVSVGNAVITAAWSEGVTTTYTLHVVDDIIAENFSKVVQTGQTEGVTWHGDLFDWSVANVRRGVDDTLGLNPRIQATALRSNAGSTLISNEKVEGGIKHIAFDWRQWGSKGSATKMYVKFYSSADNDNWGEAIASQEVDAATASTPFVFNEDVTGGAHNVYLKMEYTADAAIVAVMGAMKITPYLLYTTKEATLNTRNGLTYTNNDLINNTTGDVVVYSIAPDNVEGVSIDAAGQVTVTDETEGDFTVTATWGEVTTTYTLTVVSRTATTASYENAKVALNLGADVPANTLTKTAGYDGTIGYVSSNTAVATVTNEGVVSLAGGVGQATITATLPQTENYKAAEASYTLYVTDNSASVQVEAFSGISDYKVSDIATKPIWDGDKYQWHVYNSVRRNNDVFAHDASRQGTWMGTPEDNSKYGVLETENAIEGGVKHLTFYWAQPANTSEVGYMLKPVVYVQSTDSDPVHYEEQEGTKNEAIVATYRLFGASNVMRSNSKLIIRNESYKADDLTRPSSNRGRFLLDEIHITPYLLYNTKEAEMDMRVETTYTNNDLINNTESGTITYSLVDNDDEASINAETGVVTPQKAGQVTVKATWSEGAFTTYTLNIIAITETEASYPQAEIHATMGEAIPANVLNVTDGYDGTISYASSVPAVADFENGVLTLKAPGQTKITATLPETSNYTAATASYILTVSYSNYESFNPNGTTSTYAKPEENAQGDMCIWYVYIGGIQTPNYFSSNAITTRAQRTNESKQGYAKSAKLSGGISALAFNYSMMYADNNIEKWDIHVYVNDRLVGQLTNEEGEDLEGINGRTLNPMRTKVITGIDEPGQFVIRFENHSTIKDGVEYESGNMGRFAIDNVSWENFVGAIVLDENADNSSVIAANSGATADVELARSALVGGVWNTLCLPFDLPVSTLGVVENGVQTLNSATLNGDELEVGFTAFTAETLVAGTPYLVKPANDVNISGSYDDVTITSIASPVVVGEGKITLQGIFSPYVMTAGNQTTLFVGTPKANGENLFYPSQDGSLKGFRAYFKLNLGSSPAPKRARFVVNQTDVVTGIETVNGEWLMVNDGKFIENGQLIIIRDGKKYNAMGQIIR